MLRTPIWLCHLFSVTLSVTVFIAGCEGRRGPARNPKEIPSSDATIHQRDDRTGDQMNAGATESGAPSGDAPHSGAFRFVDRAAQAGVVQIYENGESTGHRSILESLGGGCAIIDFDGDQELDLFYTSGGKFEQDQRVSGLPSALFRKHSSWNYQRVSEAACVTGVRHYSHGTAVADFDHDGFSDILVTGYGGLQFWHNLGDGTFLDITEVAQFQDTLWSSSAAWGDFNGDNHLDLYVAHYVDWSFKNDPFCHAPNPELREICTPKIFNALPHLLYFSNGDGTFRNVSESLGLRKDGKGLGVLALDADLDGKLDLYIANDTVPNFLYHNNGNGRFEEIGELSGTARGENANPDGSMGVSVGDFNLDGLPDIWVANFENESFALYRNEGNCAFLHVSQPLGVTSAGSFFVGFGTMFFDVDRDGDEDLWVSNGHVLQYPENAPVKQLPLLFENQATRWFRNVAPFAGDYCTSPHSGRGAASGDLDGDGDLDIATTHVLEPHSLLDNQSENRHSWFQVRLIGRQSNRSAIGTLLTLKTSTGTQIRQVSGGGSYLSHSDPKPYWGVPSGTKLKELQIRWPSGQLQTISEPTTGRVTTLIEPTVNATDAAASVPVRP